jgi:SnoaL-like protein
MTDLQALLDRAELAGLVPRLAYAEDDRDYDAFRALFAESVLVDMSSLFGEPAYEIGADDLTQRARSVLGGFEYTQHHTSNVVVELDGDRATVRATVNAYHYLPTEPGVEDFCLARVNWHFGCVRTDDGWLIDRVEVVRSGPIDGDFGVYRIALERAAAESPGLGVS